jgi:chlorite dismutase
MTSSDPTSSDAHQTPEQIRYTAYAAYARSADMDAPPEKAAAELTELVAHWADQDVVVRGLYDVSAFRADADLLVWWHSGRPEAIQQMARSLRRTSVGRALSPTWSAFGVHRTAEFNRAHIPAFLAGTAPKTWVSVYPFVRSYEWYLLPDEQRRDMLAEHGRMGREHTKVLSNTVASFALGDYEWLLALESDELHEIVDLMRHLRAAEARRHVREEVPFFTGRLTDEAGVVEALR